LQLQEIVQ